MAVACICMASCSLPLPTGKVVPLKKWESQSISISLGAYGKALGNDMLYYAIKLNGSESASFVRSQLSPEQVNESFSKTPRSSTTSAVVFSPDGKSAIIQDISETSESGFNGFIFAKSETPAQVRIFEGPTRPAFPISDWPRIITVDEKSATFQYDGDTTSFTVEFSELLQSAVVVNESDAPR